MVCMSKSDNILTVAQILNQQLKSEKIRKQNEDTEEGEQSSFIKKIQICS